MSISVTPKQKETVTTDVFSCLFLDSKASFILPNPLPQKKKILSEKHV